MITIDRFAFCFFATNQSDIDRQNHELKSISKKYDIERWYRRDRNSSNYLSFSQMVNDGIDDTDSEFMIFCNPKTILKSEDVEFIIDKLSNGYCFASKVSFGLFGLSKELIRNIGMLDERFIGGGWEDNDFAIRLLDFGKAVWWEYDTEHYDGYFSRSNNLKHISTSIFRQKYNVDKERKTIVVNEQFFNHKQISNRHINNHNLDIYNSWLDSSHNHGNMIFGEYLTEYQIFYNKKYKKEVLVDFQIKVRYINNEIFLELYSEHKININFTVLTSSLSGRTVIIDSYLPSNTWFGTYIPSISNYYDSVELRLFVDDNQFYNNTIHLDDDLVFNFSMPILL